MTEVERVTSNKPKNPGRQEWGKKLGKMQKQLKLEKQAELQEQKPSDAKSFLKWEYGVAIAGLLIGLGALYYQKKSYEVSAQSPQMPPVENQKPQARFSDF